MLTEATEGFELNEAGRMRAAVYFFLVPWTREMTVEGVECPKSIVAEHTLICLTVP